MSEEMVIRCCALTLAAIKIGSLFNCAFESQKDMTQSLRCVNRCILHKGVCAIPLCFREGEAFIYLYRAAMLEQDLNHPLAEEILRAYGYPKRGMMERIMFLITRLKDCDAFPHEIGLFLGYPPADVKGFIEGKPCKCTGLWKVFESDETEARQYFVRCKNCTRAYLQRSHEGWSLSRLTIQPRQFSYKKNQTERREIA